MPSLGQFSRQFRSLSPTERAAFVADLLAARGWDTECDDRLIVATREGETRRLRVGPVPPEAPDVDEVVAVPSRVETVRAALFGETGTTATLPGRPSGATVTDPGALHRQLLYAVEREDATRLYREHFDAEFDTDHDGSRTPFSGRVALTAAIFAVILGAVALAGVLPGWALSGDATSGGVSVPAGEQTGTSGTEDDVDTATPATATGATNLSPEDISDPDRLLRAHSSALRDHPVALSGTFQGPRFLTGFDTRRSGFDADDTVTIRTHVESDSRYHVVRERNFTGSPLTSTTARFEQFADGSTEYRRIERENATAYKRRPLPTRPNGTASIESWTRVVVFRYLNTTETAVERLETRGGTRYRLVATGDPHGLDHETQAYSAVAVIEPDGWIRGIRAVYHHPNTGARVKVTVRYDRSPGPVDAPEWYDEVVGTTSTAGPPSPTPAQ